jgi:hypothetical protein
MPMMSMALVLSRALISSIDKNEKPLALIDSSSGTSVMSPYLSNTRQKSFFKEAVDKFEAILQEGRVFLFSNGTVKIANQKFTSIKNDFCLVFDK